MVLEMVGDKQDARTMSIAVGRMGLSNIQARGGLSPERSVLRSCDREVVDWIRNREQDRSRCPSSRSAVLRPQQGVWKRFPGVELSVGGAHVFKRPRKSFHTVWWGCSYQKTALKHWFQGRRLVAGVRFELTTFRL